MMKIKLPFPNGHDNSLNFDKKIVSNGIIDASTKDETITLKAIQECDVLEIREILLNEVKRQNEEINLFA